MSARSQTSYIQRVTKDLGDDYDQVMASYLDRMKNEGYIKSWEHQPHNGNGNGSVVLRGTTSRVMSYDETLEYARGFMDAVDHLTGKKEF